jgi:sigma-B regulation protein RsbU (phosphoserine phosphatase)
MRGYHRRGTAAYLIGVAASFLLVSYLAGTLLRLPERSFWGMLVGEDLGVRRVFPGSPAAEAGIQKGDRILSFAGAPWSRTWERSFGPSGEASVRLASPQGEERTAIVERGPSPFSETLRTLVMAFVNISFVGIGLVVFLSRSDRIATLFFLMCLLFATALSPAQDFQLRGAAFTLTTVRALATVFLPPVFLHFFLSFPRRSPWLSRLPWGALILYLPSVAMVPFVLKFEADFILFDRHPSLAMMAFEQAAAILFVVMGVLGIFAFLASVRRITSPLLRRSLRWVLPATALGVLPPLAMGAILNLRPDLQIPGERYVFLTLVLVPLSFAHAIVRYGLMDLELVVKRSAIYAGLTAFLVAGYYLVAEVLGSFVADLTGTGKTVVSFSCVFAAALLFVPVRDRLQELVDRSFYPSRYNYRKTLRKFSSALASFMDRDEIVRLLVHRLPDLLETDRVALFLRSSQDETLQLAGTRGIGEREMGVFAFRPSRSLVAWWREIGGPIPLGQRENTTSRLENLSDEERMLFESLSPGVVVILPGERQIEGILVLGEKRFDERYRAEDLELLATIGDQAGTAVSGTRLHEEALEKRRMEEELAVARHIQRSLLPARTPVRDGLEIAAMTRPCRQVGGDFYDFLDFGSEGLGLAVADVSGKGVPAALILSSLQATLRAEARPGRSPAPVVRRINQRLCGDLQPGSFASLLFGHLDVDAGTFHYVNAGHPAGLVLRQDGAIERLSEGGLLLGVESGALYEIGVASFGPGDLLVLYSDGVTDVLNGEEEEFGAERLERLLPHLAHLPLQGIVDRIVDTVETFVGGALPDDLTLLVARSPGVPAQNATA